MPVSHWAAAADGLAADERECFLGAQIVSIVHPSEVDLDGE
jgi:hypothetical protein